MHFDDRFGASAGFPATLSNMFSRGAHNFTSVGTLTWLLELDQFTWLCNVEGRGGKKFPTKFRKFYIVFKYPHVDN